MQTQRQILQLILRTTRFLFLGFPLEVWIPAMDALEGVYGLIVSLRGIVMLVGRFPLGTTEETTPLQDGWLARHLFDSTVNLRLRASYVLLVRELLGAVRRRCHASHMSIQTHEEDANKAESGMDTYPPDDTCSVID